MATSKQIRSVQRAIHLVAGLALVAYVYATPPAGSAATVLVRVLVPIATLSGVAIIFHDDDFASHDHIEILSEVALSKDYLPA